LIVNSVKAAGDGNRSVKQTALEIGAWLHFGVGDLESGAKIVHNAKRIPGEQIVSSRQVRREAE
jgi:hypothetical protein